MAHACRWFAHGSPKALALTSLALLLLCPLQEKWEEGYYITAMAGSMSSASLVVMSKGTPYTQQSYKVSDSFPFKWINKKWKEGFYVTSMATSHTRWAVVMSRNAGFVDQVRHGVLCAVAVLCRSAVR
jgi:hypothetical protein